MAIQRDSFPGCPTRSFFLSLWFSQRVHRQRKALDEPTSGVSATQKVARPVNTSALSGGDRHDFAVSQGLDIANWGLANRLYSRLNWLGLS
jgi:hypothetical protein